MKEKRNLNIDGNFYVLEIQSSEKAVVGTERMLALANGVKAKIAKAKSGTSIIQEFLFDRDKFTEKTAQEWIEKNEESVSKSLASIQENAPKGSFEDIAMRVSSAISMSNLFMSPGYVAYMFPGYAIVDSMGKYFKVTFEESERGLINLGEPEEVDMNFVTRESNTQKNRLDRKHSFGKCLVEVQTKDLTISEASKSKQELIAVLIEAGTNHSKRRHYPLATLKEAATLFAGLKMYIDHPTATEDREKPERSVTQWVSTIIESWFEDNSIKGLIRVHDPEFWSMIESDEVFREQIGISINASGRRSFGTIDGQQMEIIEEISQPRSVDWVTEAGARGRILQLIESNHKKEEERTMLKTITLSEVKTERPDLIESIRKEILTDARKEFDLEKEKAIREAVAPLQKQIDEIKGKEVSEKKKSKIKSLVESSSLPDQAKNRLIESLASREYESDEKLETVCKESIASELKYLSEVSGKKFGLGHNDSVQDDSRTEGLEKRLGISKEKK